MSLFDHDYSKMTTHKGNEIHNMAQFIYFFVKYQWVWNYIRVEHNLRAFIAGLVRKKTSTLAQKSYFVYFTIPFYNSSIHQKKKKKSLKIIKDYTIRVTQSLHNPMYPPLRVFPHKIFVCD